jgi:hypothetical protein
MIAFIASPFSKGEIPIDKENTNYSINKLLPPWRRGESNVFFHYEMIQGD